MKEEGKTKEIQNRRGVGIEGLMECSRAAEDRRLWRNMAAVVPQRGGD